MQTLISLRSGNHRLTILELALAVLLTVSLTAALAGCSGYSAQTAIGSISPSGEAPLSIALASKAGVAIPASWTLQESHSFGTSGNVASFSALHQLYYEGQFYNRDG